MNNQYKGFRAIPLLGFSLLASLTVACTEQASPPGFSSLHIHVGAGETVANAIELSAVQALTIDLHPRNPVRTATATGGTLTIDGQTLKAAVLASTAGDSHAGDLTAIFWKCSQIRPGKNVEVRYAFTDASGQVLEQGLAVLSSVIGTCPPSP